MRIRASQFRSISYCKYRDFVSAQSFGHCYTCSSSLSTSARLPSLWLASMVLVYIEFMMEARSRARLPCSTGEEHEEEGAVDTNLNFHVILPRRSRAFQLPTQKDRGTQTPPRPWMRWIRYSGLFPKRRWCLSSCPGCNFKWNQASCLLEGPESR